MANYRRRHLIAQSVLKEAAIEEKPPARGRIMEVFRAHRSHTNDQWFLRCPQVVRCPSAAERVGSTTKVDFGLRARLST